MSFQPRELGTHLMEMLSTPLCSVLASMAIEHGKVALTANASEIVDERMSVLHRSATLLVPVYTDSDLEASLVLVR